MGLQKNDFRRFPLFEIFALNMKKIVQHMSSQKGKYVEHSRFSTKYAEISNHFSDMNTCNEIGFHWKDFRKTHNFVKKN